jgi:hypothetical protein
LLNYNIICYKCNNYGHIEKFYRSVFRKYKKEETPIVMERNQEQREQKKEKSLFIHVALHAQNDKDKWCIDSGCSNHMTRYKTKFITLKKNEGNVTFGDNETSKIVGKGTPSLDNGRDKVEKVLCVEDLKQNILNVIQIYDQRHALTFDSQECKIIKENSDKLS